jgi:hypothetical protein
MWSRLGTVLGVLVIVVGACWYVFGIEEEVHQHQRILDEVVHTQQKVVDWMDKELQAKRAAEERERYRRELCASGKLPPQECE